MHIAYRRLVEDDLETFINMRITQLREEGATEKLNLIPALMDYYHRHMADGTFVSWLAVDGDKIIAICAKHMKDEGRLNANTAVVTVMSNMGLFNYLKQNNINCEKTKVGDRYVLEKMLECGYHSFRSLLPA